MSTPPSDCANQESKRVFLIVSDGRACLFPHVQTCSRSLRPVCSCILVPDCASHAQRRDPDLLEVGCLSPSSVSNEKATNPAAPESSLVLHRLIWLPLRSCAASKSQLPDKLLHLSLMFQLASLGRTDEVDVIPGNSVVVRPGTNPRCSTKSPVYGRCGSDALIILIGLDWSENHLRPGN